MADTLVCEHNILSTGPLVKNAHRWCIR